MRNLQQTVLIRIKSELEYKNRHLITIFNPYETNQIDKINLIYFWVLLKQILYKGPIAAKIIFLTNHQTWDIFQGCFSKMQEDVYACQSLFVVKDFNLLQTYKGQEGIITEERKIKIGVQLRLSSFESLSKFKSSLYMRDLQ